MGMGRRWRGVSDIIGCLVGMGLEVGDQPEPQAAASLPGEPKRAGEPHPFCPLHRPGPLLGWL